MLVLDYENLICVKFVELKITIFNWYNSLICETREQLLIKAHKLHFCVTIAHLPREDWKTIW